MSSHADWKIETRTAGPRVVVAFGDAEGNPTNVMSDGSWWKRGGRRRKWYQVAPAMTPENMVPLEAANGEEP